MSSDQLGGARPRWVPAAALFAAAVLVQTFHQFEHFAQAIQAKALHITPARGLLGKVFDTEWVHWSYNVLLLAALLAVVVGYGAEARREWMRRAPVATTFFQIGIVIQILHVAEHFVKITQHLTTGANPAPGTLGSTFDLVWLHFTINMVVLTTTAIGFFGLKVMRDIALPRRAVQHSQA